MVRNPFGHLLDWSVFIFGPEFFSRTEIGTVSRLKNLGFFYFWWQRFQLSATVNPDSTKIIQLKTITVRDLRTRLYRSRIADWADCWWSGAWIPCDSCTNNNCSITVYFCEDIPVTTKALAREIVKKSQIQKTSGTGIVELSVGSRPRNWFGPLRWSPIRRGPIKRGC